MHERYRDGKFSPEYQSWTCMIVRCTNPNRANWKYYGGRGISVCDRWRKSFDAFVNDLGKRPPGTTLDRIDSNGNYEPSNCRWATAATQARGFRQDIENCVDCGGELLRKVRGKIERSHWSGRCHKCHEYFRRNEVPRPRDLQPHKLIDCPLCNRKQARTVKGLCKWCYRAKWSRENRRKKGVISI